MNLKSNEYVLNYLNNDDYNFNEKGHTSFVERKIQEKSNHTHTHLTSKGSKNCTACSKVRSQQEFKEKKLLYNGVNLNASLLQCKEALQNKDYKKSETILLAILDKNVDHADVFYLLGETYRLQGK